MLPALKKLIQEGKAIRPERVAELFGVALPTVHSWVRRKKIPFIKLERVTAFDPQELAQWWENKQRMRTQNDRTD